MISAAAVFAFVIVFASKGFRNILQRGKVLMGAPKVLHSEHITSTQYSQPFASGNNIGRAFVRGMKSTGINYRDPENARHSFACRTLETGMESKYCTKILGIPCRFFEHLRCFVTRTPMPNRPQSGRLLNKGVNGTSTRCSDKEGQSNK